MADRILGDVYPVPPEPGDGILNEDDVTTYDMAIEANKTHAVWSNVTEPDPEDPSQTRVVKRLVDVDNGGFVPEQANCASLHKTGFISNIDKILLQTFINGPTADGLQQYIRNLDSAEIIPVPDPEVDTLEELREDITTNILTLMIYQAQEFLKLQSMAPTSLHDVEQKMGRMWADAYKMDYDTAAQTDANMKAGLEADGSAYGENDGHRKLPQNMEGLISGIVSNLSQTQMESVIATYWTPGAAGTISNPPSAENIATVTAYLWDRTGVESGIDFYNNWYQVTPEPSPGPDPPEPTPSESFVPDIPATTPTLDGDLLTWVNNSANSTDFTTCISSQHPLQVVTVSYATGYNNSSANKVVDIKTWEYVESAATHWTLKNTYEGRVGDAGIFTVANLDEADNTKQKRTPSGAFQLGNYTISSEDVGAFGNGTMGDGLNINYKPLTNLMHWVDSVGRGNGLTNWYNMFVNCDPSVKNLVQYKRFDWDETPGRTIVDKDGKSYNSLSTPFAPGKYYITGINQGDYPENLYNWVNTSYRHAVVIRFNMMPHVSQPVLPGNAGAGSAYFLHSSDNDSNPSNTYGCISSNDSNIQAIIRWLNRVECNPYIWIRLPS